jgi:hypothetical protein
MEKASRESVGGGDGSGKVGCCRRMKWRKEKGCIKNAKGKKCRRDSGGGVLIDPKSELSAFCILIRPRLEILMNHSESPKGCKKSRSPAKKAVGRPAFNPKGHSLPPLQ